MRYFFLLLFFSTFNLAAQVNQGLITYLSFDKPGCTIGDEAGDPAIQTFVNGDLICECGVQDRALRFDGDDDWFFLFGEKVEGTFTTIDFSLSFYFQSTSSANESQAIFTKRLDCSTDRAFSIRFNPFTKILNVELTESPTFSGSLSKTLPSGSCWYHVVIVRKGATTLLYVNGQEFGKINAPVSQRVNITNSEPLTIGRSNCNLDQDFRGFLDEIRLYNRALSREDVEDLFFHPDEIAIGKKSSGTKDTTIFLGNAVQIDLTSTCATNFSWTPTTGVSNPADPNPLITPSATTTYALKFSSAAFPCIKTDSIRITVVDPSTLDCKDILLPTAFTPNGDGLNDTYGISNPFVAGEILAFQIFDRWGNIIFETVNPLEKWDGSYRGQPVNPGVFLYRIKFRCQGKEDLLSGSVTVIR